MSREEVKRWLDDLRAADREEERQQERRDHLRGKLDTGGRGGNAPYREIDLAMGYEAGTVDLDGRNLEDEDE